MDEPSDNHRRAEALRAMAEGLNEESADEDNPGEQQAEDDVAAELTSVRQDDDGQEEPSVPPVARPVPGRTGKAGGGAFHKFMAPLLLGVAAVLLALSTVTLIKLLKPDAAGGPLATYGWWLILASCPLAGVLALTAWLLHRTANRRKGG